MSVQRQVHALIDAMSGAERHEALLALASFLTAGCDPQASLWEGLATALGAPAEARHAADETRWARTA